MSMPRQPEGEERHDQVGNLEREVYRQRVKMVYSTQAGLSCQPLRLCNGEFRLHVRGRWCGRPARLRARAAVRMPHSSHACPSTCAANSPRSVVRHMR